MEISYDLRLLFCRWATPHNGNKSGLHRNIFSQVGFDQHLVEEARMVKSCFTKTGQDTHMALPSADSSRNKRAIHRQPSPCAPSPLPSLLPKPQQSHLGVSNAPLKLIGITATQKRRALKIKLPPNPKI
jgi:hypothetical protein